MCLLLKGGNVSALERRVYDAVATAMRDGDDSDDNDGASGGGDRFKSTNARLISAEGKQAMLTMLGAALKCNGLSYEQGYMYFCSSSSCAPNSNAPPAAKPLAFLSSALQHAGFYSLARSLLGAAKSPSVSTSGYLSQPEQFARLLLRTSLDPQVLYAPAPSLHECPRDCTNAHVYAR
jgi:hypothetical protein